MNIFDQIREDLHNLPEQFHFSIVWEHNKEVWCEKLYWSGSGIIYTYDNSEETLDEMAIVYNESYSNVKSMLIVYPKHIQQFINNK